MVAFREPLSSLVSPATSRSGVPLLVLLVLLLPHKVLTSCTLVKAATRITVVDRALAVLLALRATAALVLYVYLNPVCSSDANNS